MSIRGAISGSVTAIALVLVGAFVVSQIAVRGGVQDAGSARASVAYAYDSGANVLAAAQVRVSASAHRYDEAAIVVAATWAAANARTTPGLNPRTATQLASARGVGAPGDSLRLLVLRGAAWVGGVVSSLATKDNIGCAVLT